MKKITFLIFLLSFGGCNDPKVSSPASVGHVKDLFAPDGWKACYNDDIQMGGLLIKSVSHEITLKKDGENFFNLTWHFSDYDKKDCQGPAKQKGSLEIEHIYLDINEKQFNIGKSTQGENKLKYIEVKKEMMPPFAYYKKLKLYTPEYPVYFDYRRNSTKKTSSFVLYYTKEENEFGSRFFFGDPEEEGTKILKFN